MTTVSECTFSSASEMIQSVSIHDLVAMKGISDEYQKLQQLERRLRDELRLRSTHLKENEILKNTHNKGRINKVRILERRREPQQQPIQTKESKPTERQITESSVNEPQPVHPPTVALSSIRRLVDGAEFIAHHRKGSQGIKYLVEIFPNDCIVLSRKGKNPIRRLWSDITAIQPSGPSHFPCCWRTITIHFRKSVNYYPLVLEAPSDDVFRTTYLTLQSMLPAENDKNDYNMQTLSQHQKQIVDKIRKK